MAALTVVIVLVILLAIGLTLGVALCGCRLGSNSSIDVLPDVVWFPVRESYHVAEGPVMALDERRGHFAPMSSWWVSTPTTEAGVGRHLVVPQPNGSPPLSETGRLYAATAEVMTVDGVDYVAFRHDPEPVDVEELAGQWARQGLPDWVPPR